MSECILELKHVEKHYPSFSLKDVSFSLHEGEIMGFIGRNGSGKTTTIKAISGLIDINKGDILFQGKPVSENEKQMKNDIGLLFGGVDFYPNAKVKDLTKVSSRFYHSWDQSLYEKWLKFFEISEEKKIKELSNGMKVKYGLSLALSHQAKLLLLDEPTSGLDPVSRDELLDCFRDIAKKKNIAILFSTHVISDLEKCADSITYIRKGEILSSKNVSSFKEDYLYVKGKEEDLSEEKILKMEHLRKKDGFFEGIIEKKDETLFSLEEKRLPSLEESMIAKERADENEESPL